MTAATLRRLDDGLGRVEELFLAASHGVIAALVVAAVFFRYVLNDPLTWTEESIVLLFTWMLFIGLANAFRSRMHIRIDALLLLLPRTAWRGLGLVAVAATIATLLGLTWFGVEQAVMLAPTETPMMRISAAWGVSAVPVGAALSCLHVLRQFVERGAGETLWPADLVGGHEDSVT
jgi:TRAP-type C4-dicarboxylate transport system permease small subunit